MDRSDPSIVRERGKEAWKSSELIPPNTPADTNVPPGRLRTHIPVCLATAAIAILTIEITHVDAFAGQEIRIDPLRLVEATTAGVAFLAAGLIFFAKGEVQGLTTGAGMWLAGAIGLAVGLGFWQNALLATVLALIVLGLLQIVRADINNRNS
jgi:putative Mg2+ transporter-C (MgtC) family protein